MNKTKIDWCTHTVNPVIGCTFNCQYCYARKMNDRFCWIPNFNEPKFFPKRLEQLYSKKPKVIFMNSISDIADWDYSWSTQVEIAIRCNAQHKYLFLTKRPETVSEAGMFILQTNVWNGTTINWESDVSRFNHLPAFGNRFASIEPIFEDLKLVEKHNLFFKFLNWVIIGAETGNRKEKVIPRREWIENITKPCKEYGIPVFMKSSLRELMGEDFIQELPKGFEDIISLKG